MSFLTNADLISSMYQEQLDAITQEDDALTAFGIDAAEEEMKGYLAPVYDTDVIFAKAGADRHKLLVTFGVDIAIWHIIKISKPGIDYEDKKTRYERAVEWLKQVQSGKVNPPSLARSSDENKNSLIKMTSNDKREQHY